MRTCALLLVAVWAASPPVGCSEPSSQRPAQRGASRAARLGLPLNTRVDLAGWKTIEDLPQPLALFKTVFWEPRDSESLRQWIREPGRMVDKEVLEIGTGSGLLALCMLQAGARRAVATDINPAAIANADYNAEQLGLGSRLELRYVDPANPAAYAVIRPGEQFDYIVSNPPWEDAKAQSVDQYALYDERYQLLDSLLEGLPRHLKPGGKALLAYGHRPAIERILTTAPGYGYRVRILDDRPVESLPENFLPGLLLEVSLAE